MSAVRRTPGRSPAPTPLAARLGWPLLSALVVASVTGCEPDEREAEARGSGDIRIVAGARAPDEHPDARLRIETPRPGSQVEDEREAIRFHLEGFELRAATPGVEERGVAITEEGQHLHVILGDRPYEAIYDISEPLEIGELGDLEPGTHLIRAFPSRSWHESVKTPGAFAMTWFTVGEEGQAGEDGLMGEEGQAAEDGQTGGDGQAPTPADPPLDPDAPLLTYSRPMGSHSGADADSVMVDFYLTNVELSDGHTVRLSINGEVMYEIDRWAPHYILGLPPGEHRIRLQLLDADGQPVPGPFNAPEQTISVDRE